MTATPVWFGPTRRPMFGWLHVPYGGQTRGSVVLCPSLAQEYLEGHAAFRWLALLLESSGFAVLRFDYQGTGDSAGGEDDPGWADTLVPSIGHAFDLVRQAGCGRTAAVGMRMGATLAAMAAARDGQVDDLVLWDPSVSGRSFLRQMRAIRTISLSGVADADAASSVFLPQTAADLAALDLATTRGPLATRVLVLTRPDRLADRGLVAHLSGPNVEWGAAAGQTELLDVGNLDSQVHQGTLDRIVSWLSSAPGRETAVAVDVPRARTAVVGQDNCGDIVETAWEAAPNGLFGIITECPEVDAPTTVVFINLAIEHHVGPSRLWVELARRVTALGLRAVRFDLSGLGDSPARPGVPQRVAYALEAVDDVIDAARAASPRDPRNVVLVGLCSGARVSIDAGIRLGPRGVCAINPPLAFKPAEVDSAGIDPRLRAGARAHRWALSIGRTRPAAVVVRRLPARVRALLDLRYELEPARALEQLVANGVDTLLFCGEEDARPLEGQAARQLRLLRGSNRFHYQVVPGLDHQALVRERREALAEALVEQILSHFGPTSAQPVSPRS